MATNADLFEFIDAKHFRMKAQLSQDSKLRVIWCAQCGRQCDVRLFPKVGKNGKMLWAGRMWHGTLVPDSFLDVGFMTYVEATPESLT